MSGRLYAASLVALSLIIAAAISWPVFSILAALYLLVLVAWALVERAEANAKAAKADARAEVLADEICHVHAANELLCAELAASDQKIRRLSNDLLAAQMLASDAREELAAAPAPVIPLPVVREKSPYDWPVADGHFPVHTEVNNDEIEALMRATEEN
jgi:ABC-type transport system involved in cytochrome bd biosynthesis fused ATPase/permease subunit